MQTDSFEDSLVVRLTTGYKRVCLPLLFLCLFIHLASSTDNCHTTSKCNEAKYYVVVGDYVGIEQELKNFVFPLTQLSGKKKDQLSFYYLTKSENFLNQMRTVIQDCDFGTSGINM